MTISPKAKMGFSAQLPPSITGKQAHQSSNVQDLHARSLEKD